MLYYTNLITEMINKYKQMIGFGLTCTLAMGTYKYIQSFTQPKELEVSKYKVDELMNIYAEYLNDSKALEKIIPREFSSNNQLNHLTHNLYYTKTSADLNSLSKCFSQPIWELLDRGGKRWRPFFCMLLAQTYGHSKEKVTDIAALVEIIHNGTLVIDDIEDHS